MDTLEPSAPGAEIGAAVDTDGADVANAGPLAGTVAGAQINGDGATLTNLDGGLITGTNGVEINGQDATLVNEEGGGIAGSFNGVTTADGEAPATGATIVNDGLITSDSRGIDTGADDFSLTNNGEIIGTGDQRNGTVYIDGDVDNASVENSAHGVVDAGEGNSGDGLSVQVGAGDDLKSEDISIANEGLVQGRGEPGFEDGTRTTANGSSGGRFFNGSEAPEAVIELHLTNSGTFTAETTTGFLGGLVVEDGVAVKGTIINQQGGLITAPQNGLYIGNASHDLEIVNEEGGTISSGSRALNIDGDDVTVVNAGLVEGLADQRNGTLYVDGTADDIDIINQSSGVVDAGEGNNGDGVSIQVGAAAEDAKSDDITISNHGLFQGRGAPQTPSNLAAGLRFFNGSGEEVATVNGAVRNGGLVQAEDGAGLQIGEGVQFVGPIDNQEDGVIRSDNGLAIDASLSVGGQRIENDGLIEGDVVLGDGDDRLNNDGELAGSLSTGGGDDRVDTKTGTIEGPVDLGAGDDRFIGSTGDDQVTGGLGDDRLDGRSGTDTALYNDIDVAVDVDLGAGTATRETGFSVSLEDQPVASITTAQTPAEIVAEAAANNLYFNIHTNDFPGGEIRGQLLLQSDETVDGIRTLTLVASLDAAQEPGPTSDSDAIGSGTVVITVDGEDVSYSADLSVSGISTDELLPVSGVSSIHLHNAPAGVNGPVILDIVQDAGGDVTGADPSADDGNVFEEVVETDELDEIENIVGSEDGDRIIASGPVGNVISGGGGDDFIAGGGGVDILDGGEGIDTNSFVGIGAPVIADLATGNASYQTPVATVFERPENFENLDGSANNDQLFGDGGDNVLTGNDGDDLLIGRGGGDTLGGGEGDDFLQGGGGNDALDGGDGVDTASFADIGADVTADLSAGQAQYVVGGNTVQDSLDNIENLTGSVNNDTLIGDDGDNLLAGGAGSDNLQGGDGSDFLRGDAIGSGAAIRVTVTNTLGAGGTFVTPVWFGFHDGATFDAFDIGAPASFGLERLAEDGSIEGIAAEFNAQVDGAGVDATIVGPDGVPGPIDPGEAASFEIDVDPDQVGQGFFSWATMIIPSNDAFLAVPDDPLADPIFDEDGNFLGDENGQIVIQRFGTDVLDAGTEVDNELDAAFINQTAPDTGIDEAGVVGEHPGFIGSEGLPGDGGTILGGTTVAGAVIDPIEGDFTQDGGSGQLLEIVIEQLDGFSDTLNGGLGADTLEGGGASDTFIFEVGTGEDLVLDFASDEDILDFSSFGLADVDAVIDASNQDGDDLVVDLGGGDQVTLAGVTASVLSEDNVIV